MRKNENILQMIMQSKVEQFVFDFLNNSKSIYFDDEGNLIHPGEFGYYREKLCIDLLRTVVPMRLDFGTGFIIDALGNVSHQCDIIIFDSKNTPLIENDEKQRFFPIECVVGVGEVKSVLTKSKLGEALCRLSELKKMRLNIESNRSAIFKASYTIKSSYQPNSNPRDQLFTFLICDSLNFESDTLVDEFDELYGYIEKKFRHNMILSVSDGTFMYHKNKPIYYPSIFDETFINCKVKPYGTDTEHPSLSKHAHIYSFLNYLYQGISSVTIMYPELTYYIAEGFHDNIVLETKEIE